MYVYLLSYFYLKTEFIHLYFYLIDFNRTPLESLIISEALIEFNFNKTKQKKLSCLYILRFCFIFFSSFDDQDNRNSKHQKKIFFLVVHRKFSSPFSRCFSFFFFFWFRSMQFCSKENFFFLFIQKKKEN